MPVRSTNLIKTSQRARWQGREKNKEGLGWGGQRGRRTERAECRRDDTRWVNKQANGEKKREKMESSRHSSSTWAPRRARSRCHPTWRQKGSRRGGGWGEETGLSTLRRDRRVTGQGLKVPRSDRRNIFLRYQAGEQTGRKNRASHTKQLVQKQFA